MRNNEEEGHKEHKPPVEVGQRLRLRCLSIGTKGDGIFRTSEGYVIVCRGAEPDEVYDLEVTKVLDNVGFAEIIEE